MKLDAPRQEKPLRSNWLWAVCGVILLAAVGLGTTHCGDSGDPGAGTNTDTEADGSRRDGAIDDSATGHEDRQNGGTERDPPEKGRWRELRPLDASAVTPEQKERLEELRAIGYVGGSIEDERQGVVRYDREQTTPGLNIYSSGHAPEAILMDMEGTVLHRWSASFEQAFPDLGQRRKRNRGLVAPRDWWRRIHLLDDGGLLAIFEGEGIIRLDRHSKVIWARANNAHHDLEVLPNGDIYVLTREAKMVEGPGGEFRILEDFLTLLDASGAEKWSISILESIVASHPEFLDQGKRKQGDVTHTNTLHLLGGRSKTRGFAPGHVLTSMNALGLMAVLDPNTKRLTWVRKTPPDGQHDPRLLDNGNLLFFDNRENEQASAVLEIDLATHQVLWQYRGSAEDPFYSRTCGAAERLEGGNTLITESDGGRAFEVDPAGKIVWEFFNPRRAGANGEYIAVIAEMVRLPRSRVSAWLDSAAR